MYEKDNEFILRIRKGEETPIVEMYRLYRDEFIIWSTSKFPIQIAQAKDTFQDAIIDFQENVKSGKLETLSSSVKTYLFQIAKYKIINLLKREKRNTYIEETELINREKQDYMLDEEMKYKLEDIKQAISNLPEDCQKLLKLYYFKEYDMNSIARELNYKNSDTAKSKKSICMRKLLAELNKLSKILVL